MSCKSSSDYSPTSTWRVFILHVAQDEWRCWEVVLKRHHSPLLFGFTLLHGQGCVIPQGILGTPPAEPEAERKWNAGGPVLIAGLKISCSLLASETHFPGKISQLWHLALSASENKVEKSISKRWLIIRKGSLWADFLLSPVEEPTSISCGLMKNSGRESLPLLCHWEIQLGRFCSPSAVQLER